MLKREYQLIEDTIDAEERASLAEWIINNDHLTKGLLTEKFERQWSKWNNINNSVFVNSGSSANLLMMYAEKYLRGDRNLKIIVPAVSWSTTVAPAMQLGMKTYLCDCDSNSLGLSIEHLEKLFIKHKPDILILVHVLGHINDMDSILFLCKKYGVTLFEDCCEAVGTEKNNKKVGSFGKAGSFSFYYGHHISTIEGGMVTSNDDDFVKVLKSIRSHGWARDLDIETQKTFSEEFEIDSFRELFTFYYPGFNLRSTDLNAFIGLQQMKKIDYVVKRRFEIYNQYKNALEKYTWIQKCDADIISNFGLGLMIDNINLFVKDLKKNHIDSRPLICGSIGQQPFWIKKYGKQILENASKVHEKGLYIPAHHNLSNDDIEHISSTIIKLL